MKKRRWREEARKKRLVSVVDEGSERQEEKM
jgi:hypothetical protein